LALLLGSAVPAHGSKDPCAWLVPHLKRHKLPVEEFIYIARRESGCNPKAINAKFDKQGNVIWTLNKNKTIDRGLLQINSIHKPTVREVCGGGLDLLLTLDCNLKVGSYLYKRYGLLPWRMVVSQSESGS
jgi:hypothetical protein